MRGFISYHPMSLFIYFALIMLITMFIRVPVILIFSIVGGAAYNLSSNKYHSFKRIIFYIGLFVIISFTNPIFSHRGGTILFFLNNNPITLEAFVYGIDIALMLIAVLLWGNACTWTMTSDKYLYLFSRLTPNLSLILSMALRYIPLLRHQTTKVNNTQIALGLYSKNNYIDNIKDRMRVYSIILTWSMENAIDTSASMRARGYGMGKRSQFTMFKMTINDWLFIFLCILLSGITLSGCLMGFVKFQFYPQLYAVPFSATIFIIYLSYGLLVLLPFLLEMKVKIKWIFYKLKT